MITPVSNQLFLSALQVKNKSAQSYRNNSSDFLHAYTSPRFSEDINKPVKKPLWKNPLLLFLASLALTPVVTKLVGLGENNTGKPLDISSMMLASSPFEQQNISLSLEDRLYFKDMDSRFIDLESNPSDSAQAMAKKQQLQKDWDELRSKASGRNEGAKIQLHALWVNRMYDELVNPNKHMIRFDDEAFNALVTSLDEGKITDQAFKTEVQKRALAGLTSYFANRNGNNELLDNNRRFFAPIMSVMETNADSSIHKLSHNLLLQLYKDFTADQQREYLKGEMSKFLSESKGTDKSATMNHIYKLYKLSPRLPEWKPFISEVGSRISSLQNSRNIEKQEFKPYLIVMDGLIKDPELLNILEPLVSPAEKPDVQRAVAWALGNTDAQKGMKLLEEMVEDPEFHPLAREMAIYSLAEHGARFKNEILDFLSPYAPSDNPWQKPVPGLKENIQEAASVAIQKLMGKIKTEPDFYIRKLLETSEDKAAYQDMLNRFVKDNGLLLTEQQNVIDGSLIPYRKIFSKIADQGKQHRVINGVLGDSSDFIDIIGVRSTDGRLFDLMKGLPATDLVKPVTSTDNIKDGAFNVFAKESMSMIYSYLKKHNPEKTDEIDNIYIKALKEGRLLDQDSASGPLEYFTRAGEAMSSPYKDHDLIYKDIFNKGNDKSEGHIQSELKRKDPELFEFLKSLEKI